MRIVNEKLLDQFRTSGRCEWCGRRCDKREPHHASARGMGGGKRLDIRSNLMAVGFSRSLLCPCHNALENGGKVRDGIAYEVIAEREGTTPEAMEDVRNLFRRMPKAVNLDGFMRAANEVQGESNRLFLAEVRLAISMGALELQA